MPALTQSKCTQIKTALARQYGTVQILAEKAIVESDHFVLSRIPQSGSLDNTAEPEFVRYGVAPAAHTDYIDPSVRGNELGPYGQVRDNATGGHTELPQVLQNQRGAAGCHIPGESITGGHDVFTEQMFAKAWETDIVCDWNLWRQPHWTGYFNMLRNALPRVGTDSYEYKLQELVIKYGHFNMVANNEFSYARGNIPTEPTGLVSPSQLRLLAQMVQAHGWTGQFEVGTITPTTFEQIRLGYKRKMGLELSGNLGSDEVHYIGDPTNSTSYKVNWAGIIWNISPLAAKFYLKDGQWRRAYPFTTRLGTGMGVMPEPSLDYIFGFYRDPETGVKYDLHEALFFVHPTAAQRLSFAPSQSPQGGRFNANTFNFSLNTVDGAYISCNEDNFKWFTRMLHAWGFRTQNPELMGCVLMRSVPENPYAIEVSTFNGPATQVEVAPFAAMAPPLHDDCSNKLCEPCDTSYRVPFDSMPNPADPCPDDDGTEVDVAATHEDLGLAPTFPVDAPETTVATAP